MKTKMFFSVVLASLLVMGSPVLAEDVSGNVDVTSGDMTIESYMVNNDSPVVPSWSTTPVNFTVTITDTNGWDDVSNIRMRVLQNKSNTLKAQYTGPIGGKDLSSSGEWLDLEYSAISDPSQFLLDDTDVSSVQDQDLYMDCPTGNCTEKIRVDATGSDHSVQVKYINFTAGNYSYWVNALPTINVSENSGSWQDTVNLTYGEDYWETHSWNEIRDKGAVIGLKDNQSNYAVVMLSNQDDSKFGGRGLISNSPDMSLTHDGYSTYSTYSGGIASSHWGGTPSEFTVNQTNTTTAEVTHSIKMPYFVSPDSQVNEQLFQVWAKGSDAGEVSTEIDWTGSPGINIVKGLSFPFGNTMNFSESGSIAPGKTGVNTAYPRSESNVEVDLNISGTDFSGPETFGVENSKLELRLLHRTPCKSLENMTVQTTDQTFSQSFAPAPKRWCDTGDDQIIEASFYQTFITKGYLTIPLGTPSGTYTNTYTYTI